MVAFGLDSVDLNLFRGVLVHNAICHEVARETCVGAFGPISHKTPLLWSQSETKKTEATQ